MSTEQVVLVTGGSRGIGRSIVLRMAEQGFRIAFTYAHRPDAAAETAECAHAAGAAGVATFQCDMSDGESVAALPGRVHEQWNRLDVLVNNAGITRDGALALLPADSWREVLTVNLVNTIRLTQAALPMLAEHGGVVINISSLAGRTGKEGQVPYSMTKAGVIGLTRLVARSYRDRHVRAAAILPGFIQTDMIGNLDAKAIQPILRGSVQARAGKPEEIAEVCAFLASPAARYLDGVIVPADGGFRI